MTIRANITTTYRVENSNPPHIRDNSADAEVTQSGRGSEKKAKQTKSPEMPENKKSQRNTHDHCRTKSKHGSEQKDTSFTTKVRASSSSSHRPEPANEDSVTLTRDTRPQQPARKFEPYQPAVIAETAERKSTYSDEKRAAADKENVPPRAEELAEPPGAVVEEPDADLTTKEHDSETHFEQSSNDKTICERAEESDDRSRRERNEKIADQIETRRDFAREAIASADERRVQQEKENRHDEVERQAVKSQRRADGNRRGVENEGKTSDSSWQAPKVTTTASSGSHESEEVSLPESDHKPAPSPPAVPRRIYPQHQTPPAKLDDARITRALDPRTAEAPGKTYREAPKSNRDTPREALTENEAVAFTTPAPDFVQNLAAALTIGSADEPESAVSAPAGRDVIRQLQAEGIFGISSTGRNFGVGDFVRQKQFEYQLERKPFTAEAFLQETEKAIYATLGSERSSTVTRSLLRAAEAVNAYRNQMAKEEDLHTTSTDTHRRTERPEQAGYVAASGSTTITAAPVKRPARKSSSA